MTTNGKALEAGGGRFVGKAVLITGVSDHGIGGAIARRLASEGASVALASRTEPKRLLEQLARGKRNFHFQFCDVTHEEEVRAAVAACRGQFGSLDILVNNAGVEHIQRLEAFADAMVAEMLETNLMGSIRMARAVLPHLPSPGGVIVNVSSALSLAGCAGFSVYSASKAGLNGFTQSLAWEVAPRGMRVVGVAPGVVLTNMATRYRDQLTPETAHKVRSCHPLDVGLTSDVAAAVAFLASDEARWITGVTLPLGWAPYMALPVEEYFAAEDRQIALQAQSASDGISQPVAGAPGL